MKRILFIVIFALIAALLAWYFLNPILTQKPEPSTRLLAGTEITPAKPLAEFSLTSTQGKPFNRASLAGQWTLMFFGYSDCPDICPKTLAMVSHLWQNLKAPKPNFIFVSLNPGADTPDTLKAFLGRFNESFMGLTGPEPAIQAFSKACNIYSFADPKLKNQGQPLIDHSATLLLINPQGQIQALFSPPHDPIAIAKDLRTLISTNLSTE